MVRIRKDKVRVEVFVPLGSCICNFAPLMEKVGSIASKFKDSVEIKTKSINSPEANKYGIQDMCVIVDGTIKLPAGFDEKELEDAILKAKD